MADVNPEKYGKCWSCKYCEDIGTYTYENQQMHMRKCRCNGKKYSDTCDKFCNNYIWDGKTPEEWKKTESKKSAISSRAKLIKILIIAAIATVILVIAGLMLYTYFTAETAPRPTIADIEPETIEEEATTEPAKTAYVSAENGLNLRTAPDTASDIIVLMEANAEIDVIKTENGWAYVNHNGTYGWCSENYLVYEK